MSGTVKDYLKMKDNAALKALRPGDLLEELHLENTISLKTVANILSAERQYRKRTEAELRTFRENLNIQQPPMPNDMPEAVVSAEAPQNSQQADDSSAMGISVQPSGIPVVNISGSNVTFVCYHNPTEEATSSR